MEVEKLHSALIEIGIEAKEIHNENLNMIGELAYVHKQGECFIIDKNSEHYWHGIKNQKPLDKILIELNDLFYKLLYKADKENYFFLGASYKVINSWANKTISLKINPTEGYDEIDFIKECVSKYSEIINIVNSKITEPIWCKKEYSFYSMLDRKNKEIIKRNLSKAKDFIENINYNIDEKDGTETSNELIAKEKIMYLNELGIIDFLFESNENIKDTQIGKLLEPLLEETADNLRKCIRSMKNQSGDYFDPYSIDKNVQKVKQLLILKGWTKIK